MGQRMIWAIVDRTYMYCILTLAPHCGVVPGEVPCGQLQHLAYTVRAYRSPPACHLIWRRLLARYKWWWCRWSSLIATFCGRPVFADIIRWAFIIKFNDRNWLRGFMKRLCPIPVGVSMYKGSKWAMGRFPHKYTFKVFVETWFL